MSNLNYILNAYNEFYRGKLFPRGMTLHQWIEWHNQQGDTDQKQEIIIKYNDKFYSIVTLRRYDCFSEEYVNYKPTIQEVEYAEKIKKEWKPVESNPVELSEEMKSFLGQFQNAKNEINSWPDWMKQSAVLATASFPKSERI